MELKHVMKFWMAMVVLLGLHSNMNAYVPVLRCCLRFFLILLSCIVSGHFFKKNLNFFFH